MTIFNFVIFCSLLVAATARAGGLPTLDTIVVTPHDNAGLIGEAASASEGTVTAKQLENRPLLRPAEVLEVVPGLIISQHSGDGKANQYYLRGFNLDHGTDFATSVMGMPANQPTHGHGQGYLDLQFLIPELVEHLQYRKGPYAAEAGDFATAGSAAIDYFRRLDAPFAQISIGQKGYRRGLVAGSPQAGSGNLLYAVEWTENNGPWIQPENIGKLNALLRYSQGTRDNGWSLAAMSYRAQWAATDQVPQRALDAGLISRFANLDATDGGRSSRHSLSGEWSARTTERWSRANAWFIDSKLNLWSNFTFCLSDLALSGNCNRGDQFEQADARKVYGLNLASTWYEQLAGLPADFTLGLQSRIDDIGKVGLYTTSQRRRWGAVREDRVRESSIAIHGEAQVQWLEKFRSIVGVRGDAYRFKVDSDTAVNSGQVSDRIFSPKLALIFGPWAKTEYYLNTGYGFHSNDARGITAKVNPDFRDAANFGTAVDASTPLVRAKGYELGLRSALVPNLQTSLALWRLDLASELRFVGDAGTTEPSFPSRRVGIEWANYWTPTRSITVDADFALSRARFTRTDATVPGPYIPGAIERTLSVGAAWDNAGPWSGGMRLRYFGPRALVEDNSVRSKASTIVNLQAGYRIDKNIKLALDVLNALDSKASDIDYLYESQLATEAAAVGDIHTHPAEPRTLRLTLRVGF
ncbi:MAG: TonB-dependent receptor [Sulfuritalea sp.]|nr:TonB-dependent receptor [Sulfuritalea sp.]